MNNQHSAYIDSLLKNSEELSATASEAAVQLLDSTSYLMAVSTAASRGIPYKKRMIMDNTSLPCAKNGAPEDTDAGQKNADVPLVDLKNAVPGDGTEKSLYGKSAASGNVQRNKILPSRSRSRKATRCGNCPESPPVLGFTKAADHGTQPSASSGMRSQSGTTVYTSSTASNSSASMDISEAVEAEHRGGGKPPVYKSRVPLTAASKSIKSQYIDVAVATRKRSSTSVSAETDAAEPRTKRSRSRSSSQSVTGSGGEKAKGSRSAVPMDGRIDTSTISTATTPSVPKKSAIRSVSGAKGNRKRPVGARGSKRSAQTASSSSVDTVSAVNVVNTKRDKPCGPRSTPLDPIVEEPQPQKLQRLGRAKRKMPAKVIANDNAVIVKDVLMAKTRTTSLELPAENCLEGSRDPMFTPPIIDDDGASQRSTMSFAPIFNQHYAASDITETGIDNGDEDIAHMFDDDLMCIPTPIAESHATCEMDTDVTSLNINANALLKEHEIALNRVPNARGLPLATSLSMAKRNATAVVEEASSVTASYNINTQPTSAVVVTCETGRSRVAQHPSTSSPKVSSSAESAVTHSPIHNEATHLSGVRVCELLEKMVFQPLSAVDSRSQSTVDDEIEGDGVISVDVCDQDSTAKCVTKSTDMVTNRPTTEIVPSSSNVAYKTVSRGKENLSSFLNKIGANRSEILDVYKAMSHTFQIQFNDQLKQLKNSSLVECVPHLLRTYERSEAKLHSSTGSQHETKLQEKRLPNVRLMESLDVVHENKFWQSRLDFCVKMFVDVTESDTDNVDDNQAIDSQTDIFSTQVILTNIAKILREKYNMILHCSFDDTCGLFFNLFVRNFYMYFYNMHFSETRSSSIFVQHHIEKRIRKCPPNKTDCNVSSGVGPRGKATTKRSTTASKTGTNTKRGKGTASVKRTTVSPTHNNDDNKDDGDNDEYGSVSDDSDPVLSKERFITLSVKHINGADIRTHYNIFTNTKFLSTIQCTGDDLKCIPSVNRFEKYLLYHHLRLLKRVDPQFPQSIPQFLHKLDTCGTYFAWSSKPFVKNAFEEFRLVVRSILNVIVHLIIVPLASNGTKGKDSRSPITWLDIVNKLLSLMETAPGSFPFENIIKSTLHPILVYTVIFNDNFGKHFDIQSNIVNSLDSFIFEDIHKAFQTFMKAKVAGGRSASKNVIVNDILHDYKFITRSMFLTRAKCIPTEHSV